MASTQPWRQATASNAAQFAGPEPLLIASDFDGTLSPIVNDPERAQLPVATQAILRSIRTIPGVALAFISGRGLGDLRDHVAIEGAIYAGNHGLEMEGPGILPFVEPNCTAARPSLDAALSTLSSALDQFPGVELEDKDLSATVHYRRAAPELEPPLSLVVHSVVHALPLGLKRALGRTSYVLQGFREAVRYGFPPIRLRIDGAAVVRRGKQVLELRPAVKWHKGHAFRHMAQILGIPESRTLYLGDDTTDEDAFAFAPKAVTVQVGQSPGTHARFRAETLSDAREFLVWLTDALAKRATDGANGAKVVP